MNSLEVCLSPALISQHELKGKHVVIIDIFRATSCMVTGMNRGAQTIIPVSTIDECFELGEKGMLMAGERGGKKIEGFHLGNSPFDYEESIIAGKKIVITTTNGTEAIRLSENASLITIGSFLNITSTYRYIVNRNIPVVLFCSGWKGTPCIEDTLFAGALAKMLEKNYAITNDSGWLALSLFENNENNLEHIALKSSHANRLSGFGSIKDLSFCLQKDFFDRPVIMIDRDLQLFTEKI